MNLGTQLLLDAVQIESVLERDEVDSKTEVTVTTRATNSMQICLCVLGEIKVDDDVDGLDVDTASE